MAKIGIDARLWNETGVGRYIRNLVSELQKIDSKNHYVLFVKSKDAEKVQLSIINDQWSIKVADIAWHSLQEQLEFPKILEKEQLDLVHFPYFSVPIRYKGKYVLTIHDLILHHFPTGKASTRLPLVYWAKQLGYRYVIAQAAKKAEKIITVSHATEKEIVDHLHVFKEKIVVTYEGVDERINDNGSFTNAQDNLRNSNYFLYVGNAYPHKNLEMLIEAFQSVKNINLILVGKEDYFYKKLKEKVAHMGLQDEIIFKHNVTDDALASLYHNALALVQPSKMEGFGLPILEAMKEECLVVCTDIPVFHEIAQDVPFYFPLEDVNALTNVLESIAKGTETHAKERKEKGRKLAEKFSWKKMAKQTHAIYQSCIGI